MIVVIDFETTGVDMSEDEVLQVSIIDGNYNVLLHTYCRPQKKTEWDGSAKIHGILPETVRNARPFEDYAGQVQEILDKADVIIAYNKAFEQKFLCAYGIKTDTEKWSDPMITFAKIYGEWDSYHHDYRWQRLSKCAEYYGYPPYGAHDSLEDVRATLFCYYRMSGPSDPVQFRNGRKR